MWPNDIVILGSDGLFDNVSDDEILEEVRTLLDAQAQPSQMARQLAKVAFYNSLDKRALLLLTHFPSLVLECEYFDTSQADSLLLAWPSSLAASPCCQVPHTC